MPSLLSRISGPLHRLRRYRQARRGREAVARVMDASVGGLRDKRVLEVGCDTRGALLRHLVDHFGVREAVGLNPAVTDQRVAPKVRLQRGDIRETEYASDHFDVILSLSAFEHVHGFDLALDEMYRVLKPGGHVYSRFGPIWSTSYGHHLWLRHRGSLHTYWNLALPPYCHLLWTEEHLVTWLRARYDADTSEHIAAYVFRSEEQNHMMFEDYERIVASSPFDVLLFKGYDHPELGPRYGVLVTPDIRHALRDRFTPSAQFDYDGITLLLSKPAAGEAHAGHPV